MTKSCLNVKLNKPLKDYLTIVAAVVVQAVIHPIQCKRLFANLALTWGTWAAKEDTTLACPCPLAPI